MSTISGLPAHILLVHAVVVLVPLTAALLVLIAVSGRARRRLDVLTVVLALVALASVPLTTEAGEWLEHRLPRTPLLRAHTHLGDTMLPWAVALAVATILVVLVHRRWDRPGVDARSHDARSHDARSDDARSDDARSDDARSDDAAPAAAGRPDTRNRVMGAVLALVAVVVAAGSVVTVYRIGDSGARAAWTGQFSSTPLPRPAHPPASGS